MWNQETRLFIMFGIPCGLSLISGTHHMNYI